MKNPNDVVIVAAARTPIGKFGEAFRTLRAYELAAHGDHRGAETIRSPGRIYWTILF